MSDTEELKMTIEAIKAMVRDPNLSVEYSPVLIVAVRLLSKSVHPPGVETEGVCAETIEECAKAVESESYRDEHGERAAEIIRALLSTSSRGEDLSSRDKRASLPASDGRPSVAAARVLKFEPGFPQWEEWDDDLTDDAKCIARAYVAALAILNEVFEFISSEYSSAQSAALEGHPIAREARAVWEKVAASITDDAPVGSQASE